VLVWWEHLFVLLILIFLIVLVIPSLSWEFPHDGLSIEGAWWRFVQPPPWSECLIVDLVLWNSSSCSMDLSMIRELCYSCARLFKFMYLFCLRMSSSQYFLVWLLKVVPTGVSPTKYTNVYTSSF
jgi:hypothetical protein